MRGFELTERQLETLTIIRRHIKRRVVPPSRAELCQELGITYHSAVNGHLNALARKGWIELLPSVERGIRLLREGAPILDPEQLPAVAAGNPMMVEDRPPVTRLHDFDTLVERFSGRPDCFVRVKGDSMDRIGFRSGDIVAVKRNPDPNNGDVVIARIGDEVTLKRFVRKDKCTVELQPESNNPEHKPIRIDAQTDNFEIVGVVVGAIIGTERGKGEDEAGLTD